MEHRHNRDTEISHAWRQSVGSWSTAPRVVGLSVLRVRVRCFHESLRTRYRDTSLRVNRQVAAGHCQRVERPVVGLRTLVPEI